MIHGRNFKDLALYFIDLSLFSILKTKSLCTIDLTRAKPLIQLN